uniref:Uncharacterized protein n=1 Tax=Anguilla anguilla TaxID=7936 RepID=A0A0E9S783_ANGAN
MRTHSLLKLPEDVSESQVLGPLLCVRMSVFQEFSSKRPCRRSR